MMEIETEVPATSKLRVLIVDDQCDCYAGLFKLLEHRGHTYVCAHSIEEGVQCFETQPFDIVVLDILFPGMEHEESIRAVNYFNPSKVIVVTGSDDPSLRKTCLARGAFDFLVKGASEYTVYDAILKAASEETSEPNEFDREIIINRRMAQEKQQHWTNRYRHTAAVVASTMAVISMSSAGTLAFVRFVYKQGGDSVTSEETVRSLKQSQTNEENARLNMNKDLAGLIATLKSEFEHRKEITDAKFLENDVRDAESKRDREQINKRMDLWNADISALRNEIGNSFRDLQNGQTKMLQMMVEHRSSKKND